MEDYKREPNTDKPLNERNPKWINDDYCKFIRLGQSFVDKNTEGVLAYINNHSFLDNPTFRGMRWSLMQSFDRIYIIDLHGNSKKKEVCPDGSKDENVFDIQQGVSINIFVKNGKKPEGELAEVYHCDLYGLREFKYNYLLEHSFTTTDFTRIEPSAPFYFFIKRDTANEEVYNRGFAVNDMFPVSTGGVVTAKDAVLIDTSKSLLLDKVADHYQIQPDKMLIANIDYRPFDKRYVYYDVSKIERPREKVMRHFTIGDNVGLMTCRQTVIDWSHIGVSKYIVDDSRVSNKTKERGYVFPLYLYDAQDGKSRRPNLDMEIVGQIAEKIGLQFEEEKSGNIEAFYPMDLLDYIYGILHSPSYREQLKEFLLDRQQNSEPFRVQM
jgi:predicted helicase